MNIANLFLSAAKRYPNNIAIIEGERSIRYDQLAKEVETTAAYFKKKGITKGHRVLVFVPMSIDLYRVVLALFYSGAIAVFLDEWVSKKRLDLCCKIANCQGFIGGVKARGYALFSRELRKIPIKLRLRGQLPSSSEMAHVEKNDSALITFTTGSTGTPKAANRTHGFLKEQFNALLEEIVPKPEDVDMCTLPIVLFVNLGVGSTSIIASFKMAKPAKLDTGLIISQLKKYGVTRITTSPFFVRKIAEHLIYSKGDLPTIKKIFTGGAPVFPSEASLYIKAFTEAEAKIVYGSTEAEPISSIDAKALVGGGIKLNQGLPVGVPFHKANVKVINLTNTKPKHFSTAATFQEMLVPEGSIGEILVAGPHVLDKYFKNEEAFVQNKIVVDHVVWHRTGDSGFIKEKQLYLTGRCEQLILWNNVYLSPFIIENQLQNIEGVAIGTLLKIAGKMILAVETNLKIEQLRDKIKEVPFDQIKIFKEIPRDPRHHSKINYKKLEGLILE